MKAQTNSIVVVKQPVIICSSLSDAQITAELVKNNRDVRYPSTCWRIDPGKELMGLNVIGEFGLVALMDSLDNKGWINMKWLAISSDPS